MLAESGVRLVAVVEENSVEVCYNICCLSEQFCTCESATAVLCMRVEVSFCRGVGVLLMILRCRGVQ